MNTINKVAVLGAGVLLGLGSLGAVAYADHAWTNSLGAPYHWGHIGSPFVITLGDNVTSAWDSYLATASTDWSLSTVFDTRILPGYTNNSRGRSTAKSCSPTSGRAEVCNYKYGANGWLGIATIWASGTHITQGTVKMNDTYFNTATYNTSAWKNLVMCQEVGHIFGLDHQDEIFDNANLGTCMDYTSNPATNQHPNAHDYEMLEEIYAHLDFVSTVEPWISGGQLQTTDDSAGPSTWGQEVRRSTDGRASLFVQELGGGNKVLRHVFWAEPRTHHHAD